ncbi:MAG TPA: serine/threonine protein kinase [Acidobacteria bacterium]|nr:serine/threonine protein kinase [Acidobacteriota bacterium]
MKCSLCGKTIEDGQLSCPSCGASPTDVSSLATRIGAETSSSAVVEGATGAGGVLASSPSGGGFAPGAIIAGRYRIVGLLGCGGMGQVYRADDLSLGQPVALKFLPAEFVADPSRCERFRAEVRLARKVTHPNVCRVHDLGEVDGQPFISMELVEGGDLGSLLRRIGRLSTDKGVDIARQLCAGLAAAHEKGVLHRDLKPSNVMIDETGRVRITDFGLAAVSGEIGSDDVRSGTPAYMAPEVLAGREVTERSDIYSLGLVLYEIFTGKRAFAGKSVAELSRAQRESAPTDVSELAPDADPEVIEVLGWCLETEPERRPATALAVAARLPGGDPLAAVLAAGETPSPELLAAAGARGGMAPILAWGVALLCLVLAVTGLAWRAPDLLHHKAGLKLDDEVLADRARRALSGVFGQPPPRNDEAWGFYADNALLEALEQEQGAAPWPEDLAPLRFWYRASPRQLWSQAVSGAVLPREPAVRIPGEVLAAFDVRGRLLGLRRVPTEEEVHEEEDDRDTGEGGPWEALLAATPWAGEAFESVEPRELPPVYADRRAAWRLPATTARPFELHLEAAALGRQVVYFNVEGSWNETKGGSSSGGITPSSAAQIFTVALLLISLAAAVVLARYNLRVGRTDTRGAVGLAAALGGIEFFSMLVGAHHGTEFGSETIFLFRRAGWALFIAGITWLLYVALEPGVRRRWASLMVGWLRLRSGNLSDPRVGLEVLAGVALGSIGPLLHQCARTLGTTLGQPAEVLSLRLEPLSGIGGTIKFIADMTRAAGFSGLFVLFLLLLLHLILRRRLAALTGLALILGVQIVIAMESVLQAVFGGLMVILLVLVLDRLGWLCLMVASLVGNLLQGGPLEVSPSTPGFTAGMTVLALVAAVAAWGAWAASGAAHSRLRAPIR